MTDDDDLKNLFRAERLPEPDADRRAQAIAAAMTRHTEISQARAAAPQETSLLKRLRNRISTIRNRRTSMPTLRFNRTLMAGASLAAVTLLVIASPAFIKTRGGLPPDNAPASMPVPAAPPVESAASNEPAPEAESDLAMVGNAAPAGATAQRAVAAKAVAEGIDVKDTARVPQAPPLPWQVQQNQDRFRDVDTNPVHEAAAEPLSTFSIDVDTASYSFMRQALMQNMLPPKDAVRVEEMINYFPYDYAAPETREEPFKANVSVMATPWNKDTKLMRIGIRGYAPVLAERPKSNLVLLIDTSGSMEEPNKLPLLVNAFKLLLETLTPEDTVSIVTYAGSAGTVLEPTRASDKGRIIAALDNLSAGGSTAGAEGIRQAYDLAARNFDKAGVNRVILATDGDFNVGISDPRELEGYVERQRQSGIYLSVLGFGEGNYNDELMQALAQNGNGNAAYIDTLNEARKVLVDEAGSTLFPIANDVKIQVEFNPAAVSEYRLIGYETRLLRNEDFNNDRVDAGDIGAGHTVTALYEITPKGSKAQLVDPLRYGKPEQPGTPSGDYATVKIRYKLPGQAESRLIAEPVTAADEAPSAEADFAAAVAAFGQILRGGEHTGSFSYDDVIALATASRGPDPYGYRSEFVNLVRLAKTARTLP